MQQPITHLPKLLTIREVADLLRVCPATVHGWILNGFLECIVLPGAGQSKQRRVKLEDVKRIMNV